MEKRPTKNAVFPFSADRSPEMGLYQVNGIASHEPGSAKLPRTLCRHCPNIAPAFYLRFLERKTQAQVSAVLLQNSLSATMCPGFHGLQPTGKSLKHCRGAVDGVVPDGFNVGVTTFVIRVIVERGMCKNDGEEGEMTCSDAQ